MQLNCKMVIAIGTITKITISTTQVDADQNNPREGLQIYSF